MTAAGTRLASGLSVRVSFRGVSKRFGRTEALSNVSFDVRRGEVHAVLGENGAGKSSLGKVLAGMLQPDSGEVLIDGSPMVTGAPSQAAQLGIGMVFQTSSLLSSLSILENLRLGTHKRAADKSKSVFEAERAGLPSTVSGHTLVRDLSLGQRHLVEIDRLLSRGADILVLDEPSSFLTPQETRTLLETIHRLRAEGRTILLITHRLPDVAQVADRVTVLRLGHVVATSDVASLSPRALSRIMFDAELTTIQKRPRSAPCESPLVEIRGLSTETTTGDALHDVSMSVAQGEVLGIAAIGGNGQRALVLTLTGRLRPSSGTITLEGKPYSYRDMADRIAYVPDDSLREGVAAGLSVGSNLLLSEYWHAPYSRRGVLDAAQIEKEAMRRIDRFDIRPRDVSVPAGTLSGGNLKKTILARELARGPDFILAVDPSAGLDISGTNVVQHHLLERTNQGAAVLLVSSNLDELLLLSDRIVALYHGRVAGVLARDDFNLERLGALITGLPFSGRGADASEGVGSSVS